MDGLTYLTESRQELYIKPTIAKKQTQQLKDERQASKGRKQNKDVVIRQAVVDNNRKQDRLHKRRTDTPR